MVTFVKFYFNCNNIRVCSRSLSLSRGIGSFSSLQCCLVTTLQLVQVMRVFGWCLHEYAGDEEDGLLWRLSYWELILQVRVDPLTSLLHALSSSLAGKLKQFSSPLFSWCLCVGWLNSIFSSRTSFSGLQALVCQPSGPDSIPGMSCSE